MRQQWNKGLHAILLTSLTVPHDWARYELYLPLVGLVNAEGSAGTKSFSSGDSIMDGWVIWYVSRLMLNKQKQSLEYEKKKLLVIVPLRRSTSQTTAGDWYSGQDLYAAIKYVSPQGSYKEEIKNFVSLRRKESRSAVQHTDACRVKSSLWNYFVFLARLWRYEKLICPTKNDTW